MATSTQSESGGKPRKSAKERSTIKQKNATATAKDAAKTAVDKAGEKLSETASKAAGVFRDRVDDVISSAEREARAFADRGKGQAEDVVRAFSRACRPIRSCTPDEIHDQRDKQQQEEKVKQGLCDTRCAVGYSAETENRGDDGDDKKDDGPA